MNTLADTHKHLPYYAVIFTSIKSPDDTGYEQMSEQMLSLASQQKGFLGAESARDGIGITVSYWQTLQDIKMWKNNLAHKKAQVLGKQKWYQHYKIRIAKIEKEYGFDASI